MSNLPEVYILQATKKHLEMAKSFQDDMGSHFFEHTMFDVKDALTSILALCDMEDMKQLPQVKKYIQRIVDLLHDVRLYQSSSLFNVNHVIINVINVMKGRYKSRIGIDENLMFIKGSVKSDRNHLEQFLLYSMIEATESADAHLDLLIELIQKERDAVITLRLKNFAYSPVVLKELQSFYNPAAFKLQIHNENGDTEMIIRMPISFEAREKETEERETSIALTLGELQLSGNSKSARSGHSKGKKTEVPQDRLVHGAQERT